MSMNLTVKGITCLTCLQLVMEKTGQHPLVEKVKINKSTKTALIQAEKQANQEDFLDVLSSTPDILTSVSESANCHCCTEFYFNLVLD
ncbi:hypothetical protein LMF32_04470 [Desemzia sp. C1]|uniref:hypothetical protein n=1 Tax=Desemzia TaxID=82800 RepID=UPI001660C146|nr:MULTISPECIES: hypothetical protein [Desemzia]MCI3028357.1 hypothetical protein [Desemzia sp. C1]